MVYIARLPPKHLSFLPVNLGTRMPAHINAMGQVLLAEFSSDELDRYFANAKFERITRYTPTSEAAIRKVLARVAKDRYALSDQQLQLGLRSIAVPVPFKSGRSESAMQCERRGPPHEPARPDPPRVTGAAPRRGPVGSRTMS